MKDLTPNKIYELDKEIDKLIYMQNVTVYELGKRLKKVRDDKLYESLGYDTFKMYVASKGVKRYKTISAYIYMYELFVEKFNFTIKDLADAPYYKLQMITNKVKDKTPEEAKDWLEKAKALSVSDLLLEVREDSANEGFEEKRSYPIFVRCATCGDWILPEEIVFCKGHDL